MIRALLMVGLVAVFAGVVYITVIAPLRGVANGAAPPTTAVPTVGPTTSAPAGPARRTGADADPSGEFMPVGDLPGWRQTFTDDFADDKLDDKKWFTYDGQPEGDPGGYFSSSHVAVGDGLLTIGAWREKSKHNLYVTGGISNGNDFSQTYGRFDIRFRMDKGQGVAYALLLWPKTNTWPPEIDIAEDNGRDRKILYGTMHSADGSAHVERTVHGDFSKWHTVGLQWSPKKLVYTLDGKPFATLTGDLVPKQAMTLALQSQAWFCGHGWEACPNESTPAHVNLQVDWAVAYAWTG